MKLKRIFGLALLALSLSASGQQINPLVKALLDSYQEILKENPKDYATLYERAAQYFRMSDYDSALEDISHALKYTPEKESLLRGQEYSLLADINVELKDYEGALRAVDKAIELNPTSYADIYKKGNICLYLNRPDDAYRVFSSLQRLRNRSQEAYFGIAKACIMNDKNAEAKELIKQAENADPNNYVTYCRIGDLYRDMNEPENAAASYLGAMGLADRSTRPLESLIDLASVNYPAVKRALEYAISKSSNNLSLNFLLGNIAYNSGNYSEADGPLLTVLESDEGKEAEGVYETLIKSYLAQNKTADAEGVLIQMNGKFQTPRVAVMRSKVDFANGNYASAALNARKGVQADSNVEDGHRMLIYSEIMSGNYSDALEALNEVIMSEPDNVEMLLLRSHVNNHLMGNEKNGPIDLSRAASSVAEGKANAAYRAIAKALSGKVVDAEAIVAEELTANPDKEGYYQAAVYYSQIGDQKKANDYLKKAVQLGYQNLYNLEVNPLPMVSVAPAR